MRKLVLYLSVVVSVAAHGIVSGIVIDGKYYSGYDPAFQFQTPSPTVIGWSVPSDLDRGFINPGNYTSPDIICHKSATPGGAHATVAAGDEIELQWTEWPESHHGPVLDYLAKCEGDCEKVDKTRLMFFKIYEVGLNEWVTQPGNWASDDLIRNNNSHTVKIPADIAPGNYVLRHEIIALHSANNPDGAQNYPQCINLHITGSGTESPAGVPATDLYKATDPGILVNIYWPALTTYVIPGPRLYNAEEAAPATTASSSSQASMPTTSATSEPSATTSPARSSTLASDVDLTSTTIRTTKVTLTSTQTTTSGVFIVCTTAFETAITTVSVTVTGTELFASTLSTTASAPHIMPVTSTSSPYPPHALTSKSSIVSPTGRASACTAAPSPLPLPLQDGFTFQEFLQWIQYLVADEMVAKQRMHARDFVLT